MVVLQIHVVRLAILKAKREPIIAGDGDRVSPLRCPFSEWSFQPGRFTSSRSVARFKKSRRIRSRFAISAGMPFALPASKNFLSALWRKLLITNYDCNAGHYRLSI